MADVVRVFDDGTVAIQKHCGLLHNLTNYNFTRETATGVLE